MNIRSLAVGLAVCCFLGNVGRSEAAQSIPLENGRWQVTSSRGDARDVTFKGERVFELIGGLRVEEMQESASFAESCLFFKTGKWLGEDYAMWEARMDDGEYYVAHVDQVTHVGMGITWTAHVQWLPPQFHDPAHVILKLVLAPSAFRTVKCGDKTISLKDIETGGKAIDLEETEIWHQYRFVLEGDAGALAVRTVGVERKAWIQKEGQNYALMLREYAVKPDARKLSNRSKWYMSTDMKVKRLSLLINALDEETDNLRAVARRNDNLMRAQLKDLDREDYAPEVLAEKSPQRTFAEDAGVNIGYDSLKGARRNNTTTNCWDIAWWLLDKRVTYSDAGRTALARSCVEYKNIEGLWQKGFDGDKSKDRTGDAVCDGSRSIAGKDMLPLLDEGLEVPGLGILGDVAVFISRDLASPVRFMNEERQIVQENRITGATLNIKGRALYKDWFSRKPSIKARRGDWPCPMAHGLQTRVSYLSSQTLDTDGDGRWNPENGAIRIMSYRLPLHLNWIMIVPATWFEVPVTAGNKLSLAYMAESGPKEAYFPLNPHYLPAKGNVKIAFMTRHPGIGYGARYVGGVYVVQSAKGRGLIIGKIEDSVHRDHLSIVPGTLRVGHGGKWKPFDRIPYEQRRKFAAQEYLGPNHRDSARPLWYSEHNYYEERAMAGDWGYFKLHVYGGSRTCGTSYQDPFLNLHARRVRMNPKRQWLQAGLRYDLNMTGIYHPNVDLLQCPTEYIGELYDPETGRTFKCGTIDKTNPDAIKWLSEQFRRLLLPYRGSGVAFVTTGEMGTRVYLGYDEKRNPLWSRAALQSYREFVGDPEALLPAFDKKDKLGPGMTHDVTDEKWQQYEQWAKRMFVGDFLAIYKGASKALGLGKDPYFRGGAFFAGAGHGHTACDLEAVAACPYFGIFVCEYPNDWEPHAIHWYNAARQHGRTFIILHSQFRGWTYGEVIEKFKKWSVDGDTDGLIICGLQTRGLSGRLWRALNARYHGKGPMSEMDADAVIRDVENKIALGVLDKAKDPVHKSAKTPTIRKVSGIKVDGAFSDWEGIKKHEFEHLWKIARYEKVGEAAAKLMDWTGPEDLSGHFTMGYDERAFYVAATIRDSVVINRARVEEIGVNVRKGHWKSGGDAVYIELWAVPDPRPKGGDAPKKRNQFLMIPGWGWKQLGNEREWPKVKPTEGTECVTRLVPGGYVCESALPWEVLGWKAPKPGDTMAFDIYAKDRDNEVGPLDIIWRTFSSIKTKPWAFSPFLASGTFESGSRE